jgi:hypothetical protein
MRNMRLRSMGTVQRYNRLSLLAPMVAMAFPGVTRPLVESISLQTAIWLYGFRHSALTLAFFEYAPLQDGGYHEVGRARFESL